MHLFLNKYEQKPIFSNRPVIVYSSFAPLYNPCLNARASNASIVLGMM